MGHLKNTRYINVPIYNVSMEDDILNLDTSIGITLVFPNIRDSGCMYADKRWYVNDSSGTASANPVTIISVSGIQINDGVSQQLSTDNFGTSIFATNENKYIITGTGSGGGSTIVTSPFTPLNTPIIVGDDFQEVAEKSQGQINDIVTNVTTLQNNEYKVTYFAEISTATGTITKPTGSTILLDQFAGGVDAFVSTIANGQPTGNFPTTAGGVAVDVSSFNTLGNFTLSGTPSGYPVALIYILKIKAQDYSNLDITKILDLENINAVPYIGATSNVDLGEFELKAGQIELDQSPTGIAGVAVTRWNDTIGSSETTLKGGNVILKNGVDLVARVVNKVTPDTTLTKAAYQAVRISGAQGQRLAVQLAQANNDNNSADTIGLAAETIATNQEGFIITVGQIEDINTTGSLQGETWVDGDVIYLSPTTAGQLTNVKPSAPQHIVVIAYVEYAHANHGKLYVKVMNGWELEELHNVSSDNYTTPIDTDSVLTYDVTNSIWKRLTLANLRTDILDGFNTVNLIRQEFLYTSGTQTFTLSNSASAVYTVFVNGQELRQSQYTIVTTALTIVDILEVNDRIDVIYSNATLGINPSYTKAETDTLLNAKVTSNTAITGATKTKITYDAKGLVTSGADATTSDIADSSNKRYVTDAQLVVIGNTSGTNTGDQTFLNPRVQSVTSSATVTPTTDNDLVVITAQAAALTLAIPTGTPVQGQSMIIRVKDNGTARGITWTSGAGGYRAIGITLPTTTVISKTTYVGLIYNSTDSRWDAIGVTTEA